MLHLYLQYLSALLLVVNTATTHAAKPTYTVVAPKTLRPNADYRVSVSLYDIPAPIQVNVSVVGPDNNTATTGPVVFAESKTQMLTLPIGDWTDGAYKLIVTGTGAKFNKLKPPSEPTYGGGFPIVQEVGNASTTTTTTTPAPEILTDGFRDEVSLQFQPKTVSVFIQTDKAMYKPGQKVQFRALVVTPSLLPVSNASVDIHIKDGNGNRVKQWTGLTPIRGVVSQELQLSEQPVLGEWAIVVELSGVKHQKAFSVAEYVLPTFDVEVVLPKYTTRDRPDIVATVKALYTYGQGVKGDLTLTVQTKEHYSRSKYRTRYPIDGSVDIPINLMDDLSLDQHFQNMEIEVIGVVKEALTGRSYNRSNTMKIYDRDVKVEQVKTSQTFKPGLKYPVLIKVTDQDDKPVPENGHKLTLKYGYTYEDKDQKTVLLSPVNGLIAVDLYPPNNTEYINLRAEYMGKDYWLENIQKAQSPSGNYIQVVRLESDKDVSVGQQLRFAVNATEPIGRLVCEVLGKGDIVWAQSIDIPDNKMTHEFGLEATLAMVPTARLVCHYLRAANQEVVADGLKFDVSGTLRTPVSVTTDVQTTKPGAPVEVRVSTKPDAYVGLLGVDQSVLLLKSGYDITREDVDKELKTYDSTGADDQHRYGWWQNSVTAGEIFDNSGVVVMSNGLIHRQRAYGGFGGGRPKPGVALPAMDASFGGAVNQINKVSAIRPQTSPSVKQNAHKIRKHFPETWLWESAIVGSDGSAAFTKPIPDTITSWFISAFAMDNETGLGIADKSAKVTVFRPFFIKLSLPYSIIRGESVALKAIVFNYMNKEIETEVVMNNKKSEFEFTDTGNELHGRSTRSTDGQSGTEMRKKIKIPANDGVSVEYVITPKTVGYIDIQLTATTSAGAGDSVLDKLVVKPEGQTQYFNKALLVDLRPDANATAGGPKPSVKKDISISMPANAVPGSESVSVSAIGDIMGPAVNNLDDLLRMPYGCGEQNMLNFVPNIVVLNYLKATNRLTPTLRQKALKNIESGYQRELTYRRTDGSFSAFGNSDRNGSTWLTAFVLKSFTQAKGVTEIDQKVIDGAINWLFERQHSDGYFEEPGVVLHKAMQGGSTGGKAVLTAYVLIAILQEPKTRGDNNTVKSDGFVKAETYIRNALNETQNPYDLSIMAHALHLADSPAAGQAFDKLMGLSKNSGEYKWWEASDQKSEGVTDYSPKLVPFGGNSHYPNSYAVESTAYALLTLVGKSDLETTVPVLRWLISKQNSNGGFASTQDTVIGIQALGSLAQRLSTTKPSMDVMVKYMSPESKTEALKIDDTNSLVLQRIQLPANTTDAEIEARGVGAAIVQVSYQYNLANDAEKPAFFLKPVVDNTSTDNYMRLNVSTHLLEGNATNMAVMEVELPSGFVADKDSLPALDSRIKRIDTTKGDTNVIIYFDKITGDNIGVTLGAHRVHRVANNKAVPITVYDYYDRQQTSRVLYEPNVISVKNMTAGL